MPAEETLRNKVPKNFPEKEEAKRAKNIEIEHQGGQKKSVVSRQNQ
jgi:hypothetical protein